MNISVDTSDMIVNEQEAMRVGYCYNKKRDGLLGEVSD